MIAHQALTLTRKVNSALSEIPTAGTYDETPEQRRATVEALEKAKVFVEGHIQERARLEARTQELLASMVDDFFV